MATLLQDNFDRANNASVVGAPQVGPTPTVPTGVAGISTNQLYASTGPANIVYNLGTTDVEMSATMSAFGSASACSFILGYAGALIYYIVSVKTTSGIELIRQETAGFYTRVQYLGSTPNPAGCVVKVHHKAGIIRVWLDGTLIIRHDISDVPITTTSHGVRLNSSAQRADNLLAIDAPTIAEPPLTGDIAGALNLAGDELYADPGFAYLVRDLKTQDEAAGA